MKNKTKKQTNSTRKADFNKRERERERENK